MGRRLSCSAVAREVDAVTSGKVAALSQRGIVPKLCIIMIDGKPDDEAYRNAAVKKLSKLNMSVECVVLPSGVTDGELHGVIKEKSADESADGILLMRPLPPPLDTAAACALIPPEKDVDGACDVSLASVFRLADEGFLPCTAEAVIDAVDTYCGDISGKNAVVAGSSLVIGRPVAMLMLKRGATVTLAHYETVDLPSLCRSADILVAATGNANLIDRSYIKKGAYIFDVGINEKNGELCGDVDYADVLADAAGVTPVPNGIGRITSSVLALHTARAAERRLK